VIPHPLLRDSNAAAHAAGWVGRLLASPPGGPGANSISARRSDGSCPHAAASRRRTRVVGAFPEGQSALNPVGDKALQPGWGERFVRG
jgi:hypothetical protein